MSKIINKRVYNYDAKLKAFPYQFDSFNALKDLKYSAIFHEQGLGKTKIAIDLLLYWLTNKNIDTVIIATKKQLIKNWQDEFKNHTFIIPRVLNSDKKNNFYVFNSPSKVVLTNFETFSSEEERMELFLKSRDTAIIIDESVKLKNPDSNITQTFFRLSKLFKIKCIMSGTPVANRPYDIWAQVFFLDNGESLGNDFETFKKSTDLSNKFIKNTKLKNNFENSVSNIYPKISSFSVRETKNSCGIHLPNKVLITEFCEFEKKQLIIYNKLKDEMRLELTKNGEVVIDDDTSSLKRLLRLNQIASNPKLLDETYNEKSAKEIKLDEILSYILSNGEKCIVWSYYIDNINYFCNLYKKYNAKKIHGSMTIDDRNKSVDFFKNNTDCKVLFATPQAAKEGLTLTVANHVIFYDRGFNLDDYLQAQDRIHRISQKKECYVHNIMIKNSIDEWIDKLLLAKQKAAFLTQGDISLDEYKEVADYSYGELIRTILNEE